MDPDFTAQVLIHVSWIDWLNCREEGEEASQALRRALKEYDLNFSVLLNDPDMAPFRAMPEFRKLQEEVIHSPFRIFSIISGIFLNGFFQYLGFRGK